MRREGYSWMRRGVALIELIFAIVIIGLTLMSVPNLLQIATQSGYVSIQQEAINEAATHLNIIMGYHWDENDTDTRFIDPILKVNAGDNELDEYANTGRRAGTPLKSMRSFIREDGKVLKASSLGLDTGESKGNEDDVDDFNNQDYSLVQIESATEDYIEKTTVNIHTDVNYLFDSTTGSTTYRSSSAISYDPSFTNDPGDTTNIKHIRVTLTSTSGTSELNKNIVLDAFICNIGATQLAERRF